MHRPHTTSRQGVTTYNEVADELVKEFEDEEGKNDEKNIRRRVYDALNVLSGGFHCF